MDFNFANLREKDVIDISLGKRLGKIDDIIFDDDSSSIKGFVIYGQSRAFGFKKSENKTINISDIELIGEDVILVKTESTPESKQTINSEFVYTPKVFKKIKLSDSNNVDLRQQI